MIRINLLPQKRRVETTEGSQLWLVVALVLFLAELAGLFAFHGFKREVLKEQNRKNDCEFDHGGTAMALR